MSEKNSIEQSGQEIGKAMIEDIKYAARCLNTCKTGFAYRDWQWSLKTGDKLPRGKWFIGKRPGKSAMFVYE